MGSYYGFQKWVSKSYTPRVILTLRVIRHTWIKERDHSKITLLLLELIMVYRICL